mgnify:CR=1 FL=1
MSRFDAAKIDAFDAELHALVQKYLDMKDVDALAMYGPLWRRAEAVKQIGCHERLEFRDELRKAGQK